MLTSLVCCLLLGSVAEEPYQEWVAEKAEADHLPQSVAKRLSAAELAALGAAEASLPVRQLTTGLTTSDGAVWIGSTGGLMYRGAGSQRWRLFHSRRWLPDDNVEGLALDGDGVLWIRTPKGIARLDRREMTLEEKMAEIHAGLRRRHLREGLVGSIHLKDPEDPDAGWTQGSNDNDGLWTSLYVAAESYRYAVTGKAEARKNARESLDALMFLEQVTGLSGFVARSIVPKSDEPSRYGGRWYASADDRWWWKGDTSSDEVDGHYFAYAVYYDLVADAEEKRAIRALVRRITDHIIDHGFYYVGPTGKPTTWGVWAPEKLNHDLNWLNERGLNSLELLSHLKVAEYMTGDKRYTKVVDRLVDRHSYAMNTVRQKFVWPPQAVNHSDDELAFLAYHPLLQYERDPLRRKFYAWSIERSWRIERPEHSPFFNYIYAASRQAGQWPDPSRRPTAALVAPKDYDHDLCVRWFRDVPLDRRDWRVANSHRDDVTSRVENRFGKTNSRRVLPVGERRLMRWNGDPYELDGGSDGHGMDDGTYILLPYWMGRYHRFLE